MAGVPDVTVIIPVRLPMQEDRSRNLGFVRAWWDALGYRVRYATATSDIPWCKGRLWNEALAKVDTPLTILTDADIVMPQGVDHAVEAIRSGVAGFTRFGMVIRLSDMATKFLLSGGNPIHATPRYTHRMMLEENITNSWPGQVPIIGKTELLRQVPFDPRFIGWGGEDHAWGFAAKTMFKARLDEWGMELPYWATRNDVVHLYHAPQERMNRQHGSPECEALHARYKMADGKPKKMEQILKEITDG